MSRKPAIPQQAIVSSMVQVLVGSAGVVEIGPLADVHTGVVEVWVIVPDPALLSGRCTRLFRERCR